MNSNQVSTNNKLREHYLGEIASIRGRIKDFILERDDIVLNQNPAIEADYMSKIGCYEIELAEAEINERRAKRKLAMCKAAKKNDSEINEALIDEVLDKEFDKWLNEAEEGTASSVVTTQASKKEFGDLSFDVEKLKKLYRKLCKILHPDLCPDVTDEQRLEFHAIQKAHDSLDYVAIVAYCDANDIDTDDRYELLADSQIAAVIESLKAQEGTSLEALGKLKTTFPYVMKDKLTDSSWVESTANSLILRAQNSERNTLRLNAQIQNYLTSDEGASAEASGE
ncbi:MAG: J domain-containing protein [Phoenicibacter congonensis]|uniref:J domain-containing protein n=1 Tax=Phoenicibacter congonensis TaxID=1944646 RepID=A0AA43RH48_9ACTN|nr:J domain-containing protein [Phoenicibacter congonensis]